MLRCSQATLTLIFILKHHLTLEDHSRYLTHLQNSSWMVNPHWRLWRFIWTIHWTSTLVLDPQSLVQVMIRFVPWPYLWGPLISKLYPYPNLANHFKIPLAPQNPNWLDYGLWWNLWSKKPKFVHHLLLGLASLDHPIIHQSIHL